MDNIENLTRIDYSTVFLWIFILLFAIKEFIELFSYFKKRFRIKTGVDTEKETIEGRISKLETHDKWQYNEISKISKGIDEIKSSLAQKEIKDKAKTVATLRSQLYDLHSKFVEQGYIDKSGLKTFTELGSIYESAGGNDIYHDKLKPEVLSLPIKDES
jgi:hypothetical protein|nr:MAG TPA: hypothetical protein [Caudoviricetes sp.]